MKKKLFFFFVLISSFIIAQNDFSKKSKNKFYRMLSSIDHYLKSYQKLTIKYLKEKYKKNYLRQYSRFGVKGIKNTHWDMQNIGFSNIIKLMKKEFLKKEKHILLLKIHIARIKEQDFSKLSDQLKLIEEELAPLLNPNNYID